MFDNMRFTAANSKSPISGALLRALHEHGELSIGALRALSPLSDKAQVMVDKAVVEVGLERLTVAADLMSLGLTYPISDPLSVTHLEWETINKVGHAQRSMTPSARGENQLPDRQIKRLPIYLTTDDFSINIRTLRTSERSGQPLDLSLVKQATRRVNESIEDAVLNGATTLDGEDLSVGGYSAPGILNAPNANTHELSVDWTGPNNIGTTGPAMVQDVLDMIAKLQADHKYGPYTLYVGTKVGTVLEGDFKVNTSDTIRQRLERINAGGRNLVVRVADRMPGASTGTQVALVQMTSDVVELVVGQQPTVIPWTSLDGFTMHWLVMAVMVPRVRCDYNGNSGICLGQNNQN